MTINEICAFILCVAFIGFVVTYIIICVNIVQGINQTIDVMENMRDYYGELIKQSEEDESEEEE